MFWLLASHEARSRGNSWPEMICVLCRITWPSSRMLYFGILNVTKVRCTLILDVYMWLIIVYKGTRLVELPGS